MAQNEATLLIRIKQAGSEVLDKISDNLDTLKQGALLVVGALVAFGTAAIHAFKESEQASNALTQSMIQQGIYTTELKKKYDEMAAAIQSQTTYADEQVTAAQAIIQSHIGQIEITKELLTATANLAAAQKIDLNTAAQLVGKTIGGTTNMLSRQQIEVDKNATATEKLSQVITGLNSKFGGQAAAAAQGLGVLDQLRVVIGDIAEKAGEVLAPAVEVVARQLISLFQQVQQGTGAFNGLKTIFIEITGTIDQVFSYLTDMGQNLGGFFGTLSVAISEAMSGNFKQAAQIMRDGHNELNKLHEENIAAYEAREKERQDSLNTTSEVNQAAELEKIKAANANKEAVHQEFLDKEFAMNEARRQEKESSDLAIQSAELESVGGFQDQVISLKIAALDKQIADETNYHNKRALLNQKAGLQEKLREETLAKDKVALQKDTFSTIATLSSSNNSALAAIGKAAGVTQIAIDTPVAVSKALAAFPPPFNFVAAGLVATAMAAQAAKIAGIPLAEGGIVRATPGGTQATIGEGGRDEAVIPLDSPEAQGRLGGGSVTINFNGPLMGDESQAMTFARAVDKSLLKLRQSNQSVAFETDIF